MQEQQLYLQALKALAKSLAVITPSFYNLLMLLKDLDPWLRKVTEREKNHFEHPDELSWRYSIIPKTTENGQDIYRFSFDSELINTNICITKESRFTWIPLHRHEVIEMNYVYSGECTQVIDGHEVHLGLGDICLLDRNVVHEVKRLGEDDIIITVDMKKQYLTSIIFPRIASDSVVSRFLVHAMNDNTDKKEYFVLHTGNAMGLRRSFEEVMCEYWRDDHSSEVIDSCLVIIFSRILRIWKSDSSAAESSSAPVLLLDILQYIDTNYLTVTLDELSKVFGYNAGYIGSYIKKYTGHSFKELTLQRKMNTASAYLMNTDKPVYEIAEIIGYNNLGFFYQKFRNFFGVNPQEYRDQHR